MVRSPQKLFTADDVAKLVEIARAQMKKETEAKSGWSQPETKLSKHRERTYAKDLVEDFQRSPDAELKCWQCNFPGHKSSACPRGERCFTCNSTGHKRVDCPYKRKWSAAEKGKEAMVYEQKGEGGHLRTGGKLWIREEGKGKELEKEREETQKKQVDQGEYHGRPKQVVRQSMGVKQQNQSEWQHRRSRTAQTVFVKKTDNSVREAAGLRATGGVLIKANGCPSIKDFIDALKNMCSTYEAWEWKPIPIQQGVLFQFPSE